MSKLINTFLETMSKDMVIVNLGYVVHIYDNNIPIVRIYKTHYGDELIRIEVYLITKLSNYFSREFYNKTHAYVIKWFRNKLTNDGIL